MNIIFSGNSSSENIQSAAVNKSPDRLAGSSRKVLGIDPGITATGFAIINDRQGICTGTIRPKKGDVYQKIEEICDVLEETVRQHRPDLAALEKAFHHKNVASLVRISELRGAIIHTLIQAGVRIVEFMPTHVKLSTTGNGRASKIQVRYFIERLFPTGGIRMSHHATDALAIAYTASRRVRSPLGTANE